MACGFAFCVERGREKSTEHVVEKGPAGCHLDGVFVEAVQHFEENISLRRFELQFRSLGEQFGLVE